jgi:hypothetical protein
MTSTATNALKTPIARTLEQFANRKVHSAINLLGQNLPCTVANVVSSGIVKVNFELTNVPFTLSQITVPVLAFEYVRYPIQKGCKGGVISFDAYMGGMSGLGGGTADLTPRPNLSNLMFVPSGNSGWSAADDPNAVVIYGPDGAIIRDAGSNIVLKVQTTVAELNLPVGVSFIINGNVIVNGNFQLSGNIESQTGGTYAGNITTTGNVIAGAGGADQVGLQTHGHPGNNQPPTPGT